MAAVRVPSLPRRFARGTAILVMATFAGFAYAGAPLPVLPRATTCTPSANGDIFDVGPGQALAELGDVNWNALGPGDTVRVAWRQQPYRSKILIRGRGTASAPITLCGIASDAGALPVIEAESATTRADLDFGFSDPSFNFQDYALLTIYDRVYEDKPAHIHVRGLELRGAREGVPYFTTTGAQRSYIGGASCLRVQEGDGIQVEGNILRNCDFGLFTLSQPVESQLVRELYVGGNVIVDNGRVGSYFEHNLYLQTTDVVVEFNHIGAVTPGSLGSSLKDRSGTTVIRYNRIDCSARCIDLVEPQEHWAMLNAAAYVAQQQGIGQPVDPATLARVQQAELAFANTPVQVYGNVMTNRGSYGSGAMVHYGADGIPAQTRIAPLYFFHNTVSVLSDRTSQGGGGIYTIGLIDRGGNFSPSDPALPPVTVSFFNNIIGIVAEHSGMTPSFLNLSRTRHMGSLTLQLAGNWLSNDIAQAASQGYPEPGTVVGMGGSLFGTQLIVAPDDGLPQGSVAIDAAPALPSLSPAALAVTQELELASGRIEAKARPQDGVRDLGAREGVAGALFANGFE